MVLCQAGGWPTLRFAGSAKIEIDVKNNTNWVVLHSKGLDITEATILDESEAHLSDRVLPVLEYPPHEQIAIFSPKILNSGEKYFLYLQFAAPLGSGYHGRETALLLDPATSSASDQLWVTMVIGHELAHQVWYLSLLCFVVVVVQAD